MAVIEPTCPFQVDRPVMGNRWGQLTFLHWTYDADVVQRILPPWLEVETWDDRAYVALVPFFMRVSTGRGLVVPWASHFCETNVRTYVRDREGRSGIWFLSLEAARFGAVAVARTTYGLPYFWADMDLRRTGDEIAYRTRRRWPGPSGASSTARIAIGDAVPPAELTQLEHFLTARWILFSSSGRRHRFARAWHEPWSIRRATVLDLHDELLVAGGLPAPEGEPLVHYSEGVDVRIGRPERLRAPG